MPRGSTQITVDIRGANRVSNMFETATDLTGDATWVVGTHVEYAVHLEFGTSRMPPYPFLRPAVEYVMANKANAIADRAGSIDDLVKGIATAIEERAKHYASSGVAPGPDVQTGNLRSSIRARKVS